MKFTEFDLDPAILKGIEEAGFEKCTPVQEKAIPYLLAARDLAVQSQTGTGKTAAFLIPIFHLLLHDERYKGRRVLVIAPTRELAVQIEEEASLLGRFLDFRVASFYGGVGYKPQQDALARGSEILVGTPGRLIDLNESGYLDFKEIGVCVVDEADRLFDMGFYPDIRKMLRRMVDKEERLTTLFSATLGNRVRNLAWEFMNDAEEVVVTPEQVTVEAVEQTLYHVSKNEKMELLLGLLKKHNPSSALIFANTKRMVEEVAKRLDRNGYTADYIIGDLPQKKRLKIIRTIKEGKNEILVATDVAARGLHIDNLDLVINYDLPEDPENYVHRIGRTARAGAEGKAVSLACERFVYSLEPIESFIKMKIPVGELSEDLFARDESRGQRIEIETGRDRMGSSRRGGGRDSGGRSGGGRSGGGRSGAGRSGGGHAGGGHAGAGRSGAAGSRHGGRESSREKPPRERAARENSGVAPEREERAPSSYQHERAQEHDRKRRSQRRAGGADERSAHGSPSRDSSLDDRIAYYKQKYGEEFQPTEETRRAESSPGRKSSSKGSGNRGKQGRKPAATEEGSKHDTPADAPRQKEPKGLFGKLRNLFGGTK